MDWSTARSIADNPAAEQAIAGATIYEIVSYGGTVAPGLPAIPTLDFKSVSTMAQAFSAGDINSWDRAVVYDPEHWSQTPLAEQQSVVAATAEAAQLAAAHHLTFIATPATDLMEALTPGQWPLAQDYLSYNLAGKIAAAGPQLLGVQAQAQEENPSAYGALTAGGAAQVRDANASVAVIGDLTDHIGSTPVPVASVVAAAGAVDQVVDGFFLNAPTEGGAIIQALG